MDFRDGDLAYRINFATADWPEIVDRRVGRDLSSEEAHALADEVNRTLRAARRHLRAAGHDRASRRARDPRRRRRRSRPSVTNTDPAYRTRGPARGRPRDVRARWSRRASRSMDDRRGAERAADLTNAFVEGVRADPGRVARSTPAGAPTGKLPGNLILTRDGGDHLPATSSRSANGSACRGGASSRCPSSAASRWPSACSRWTRPAWMPAGFGPAAEEAYAAWAHLAAEALGDFQALYVHIKGPDVPAHDGRAEDKRDVIDGDRPGVLRRGAPAARPRRHGGARSRPTTPPRACARRTRPTPCRCS